MARDCVGISYSKSWKSIKNLELALGVSIIESTVGGKSGGNSQLTAAGKYFLRQYDEMLKDAEKLGKWLFSQYFSDDTMQKIQKLGGFFYTLYLPKLRSVFKNITSVAAIYINY